MTSEKGVGPARGQLSLFSGEAEAPLEPLVATSDPDAGAREFAVDPRHNVVLEASAGTGKTTVLVSRYVNLLRAGVDPANILAITFTRKAAAEMRERIIAELRRAAAQSPADRARWGELRDRLADVSVGTIDAFCLSLLREFPLEADLDPGFEMADETEVPRIVEEALDQAMRAYSGLARTDPDVALVLAQLGAYRTREGLATLLARRLVAWDALDCFLARGPADLTADLVCRRAATALHDVLRRVPGGLAAFLADGPVEHPRYQLLVRDVARLADPEGTGDAELRAVIERLAGHFLTADGRARAGGAIHPYKATHYPSAPAAKRHRAAVFQIAPGIERAVAAFGRDLNAVLARGIRRMFAIALDDYRRALDDRSVLDFADVLQRAIELLRRMDEFAQSRFRLESRYHHVLVDEFQDTSRAQWELVALLVQSWGEGLGLATSPSIFIVGDRKQSIYRFRDADVGVLDEAARYIEVLRPQSRPRRAITRSFRAVPGLLHFVNEVFAEMAAPAVRRGDEFTYAETDRFPIEAADGRRGGPVLGIAAADDPVECARAVAAEIARLLRDERVRDRDTGVPRPARPGDIAILFRSRTSHREFERELELRGIPAYVYKGLGFFDADETKDVMALVRYLADPSSNLRAAAFLRSRFVRLSDPALASLAPDLAASLLGEEREAFGRLAGDDRAVLRQARVDVRSWLARADRVRPAELVERILDETAYAFELGGPRRAQARENLKKMRGLVRRVQNRGFATLRRLSDHLDSLTAGDESNAVLEAVDAVNLMTVHASKGLEFPIVFVVNMAKGASGPPRPVRLAATGPQPSVAVGPFVSEADEADRDAERQETRRLLYVALTRARDRLYLASALKEGVVVAGRGSLAEVLPASLRDLFGRAVTTFPEFPHVAWTSAAGATFEWRICRAPADLDAFDRAPAPPRPWAPIVAAPPPGIQAVTTRLQESGGADPASPFDARLTGTLIHKLFHLARSRTDLDDARLETLISGLMTRAGPPADPEAVLSAVRAGWRSLQQLPDVLALLGGGECLYEVPFSMVHDGTLLRGRIDCVVRHGDSLTVLEFKTGRPRPADSEQLDHYVGAVRLLFPASQVHGRIVYL